MNPYAFLVVEVLFVVLALVVATIKSKDGLLDWVKWVVGAWATMNALALVFKMATFLLRTFGGGGDAA